MKVENIKDCRTKIGVQGGDCKNWLEAMNQMRELTLQMKIDRMQHFIDCFSSGAVGWLLYLQLARLRLRQ